MSILLSILAGVLVLLALLAFASAREMGGGFVLRIPGIGPLTAVSGRVVGLALAVIAYHLLVEAWGWTNYRAPWPWVLIGSAVAIVLALGTDRLERDADERQP
jgi:hypothetical protein